MSEIINVISHQTNRRVKKAIISRNWENPTIKIWWEIDETKQYTLMGLFLHGGVYKYANENLKKCGPLTVEELYFVLQCQCNVQKICFASVNLTMIQ